MSQVNISKAAKLAGITRATLYRAIQDGRVSATVSDTGHKQVETSELMRVYGQLQLSSDTAESVSQPVSTIQCDTEIDTAIQVRLAVAEAENMLLRERVTDLQNTMRLLEYRKPLRWWQTIFKTKNL